MRVDRAKRRRLDVHVDFRFRRRPWPEGDSAHRAMQDIERYIARRLERTPVDIEGITTDRYDDGVLVKVPDD